MNKKIFTLIFIGIFLVGGVQASLIGLVTSEGLNFVNPQVAQIVKGIMCVTSPSGAITCAENFAKGKIIGAVSGEVLQQIAQVSPEAAQAIIKYNTIKGYIDRGAEVLKEIKIDENGFYSGAIGFPEGDNDVIDSFPNSTMEGISVSNCKLNYDDNTITMEEGGYLKLKFKDEQGNIQERNYENIAEGGKIELKDDGTINSALFTTTNQSTYIFGENKPLDVKANTEITYKDGVLSVSSKDKFLYNGISFTGLNSSIQINSDVVSCKKCNIDGIGLSSTGNKKGFLRLKNSGYLISNGKINYKQNLLNIKKNSEQILIAKSSADMSNYHGNWLQQKEKTLEIHSSEDGAVFVKFLKNNKILNTDDKDHLLVRMSNGDGIKIINRNEQGIIPEITHENSENGRTLFRNDKIDFFMNKDKTYFEKSSPLSDSEIIHGAYQSVAVEIKSDSLEQQDKIIINSYRQFNVVDKNKNDLVTYNKYKLPISTKIEDNNLQTLEQFRAKYPSLNFEFPEFVGLFEPTNVVNATNVPPYLLYLTDNFLQQNPRAISDFSTIKYSTVANAWVESNSPTLMIGIRAVDPVSMEFPGGIREVEDPVTVLKHEYEHRLDHIIRDRELTKIENLGDPRIDSRVKKINEQRSQIDSLIETLNAFNGSDEDKKILKDQITTKKDFADKLSFEINDIYYDNYKEKTLQQKHNEIAVEAESILLSHKKTMNKQTDAMNKRIINGYIRKDLTQIVKDEKGVSVEEYLKQKFKLDDSDIEEIKKEGYFYQYTASRLLYKDDVSTGTTNYMPDLSNPKNEARVRQIYDMMLTLNDKPKPTDSDESYLSHISSLYDVYSSDNDLRLYRNALDQLIRSYTGITYVYGLRNYQNGFGTIGTMSYGELSSTYREMPIEERNFQVHSALPKTRKIFTKLTQLAFDSGKMGVDEYKQVMGDEYCKTSDCLDRVCSEYQLLCCDAHPNSPNC